MRIIKLAVLLFLINFSSYSLAQQTFDSIKSKAMKGDYQAQRNLAYGYVAYPYEGQDKNPILGCAWYTVVLHSGNTKVNETDVGNFKVYCENLDKNSGSAATAQARTIYQSVYKKQAKF